MIQNVALQLRLRGVRKAEAERRAHDTCALLEIDHLVDRPVQRLAGGEAQKVALCAAVAHGPQLLLADEPTGELDQRSAGEVYDLLARIAADGTGIILVSHDPRAVAFTDRANGDVEVRVHQTGRDAAGTLLFDQYVLHVYAYRGDLVERMTIEAAG